MYFVTLNGGSSELSLFLKVPPKTSKLWRQLWSYEEGFPGDAFIFQREFDFYHYVCKLFHIVDKEKKQRSYWQSQLYPKSIEDTNSNNIEPRHWIRLIFEDLRLVGFRIWKNEFDGLDLSHALIAIETFAKFHAPGMMIRKKEKIQIL